MIRRHSEVIELAAKLLHVPPDIVDSHISGIFGELEKSLKSPVKTVIEIPYFGRFYADVTRIKKRLVELSDKKGVIEKKIRRAEKRLSPDKSADNVSIHASIDRSKEALDTVQAQIDETLELLRQKEILISSNGTDNHFKKVRELYLRINGNNVNTFTNSLKNLRRKKDITLIDFFLNNRAAIEKWRAENDPCGVPDSIRKSADGNKAPSIYDVLTTPNDGEDVMDVVQKAVFTGVSPHKRKDFTLKKF